MNKFLFQTPNKDIYTYTGTEWVVIGNGEPTDLLFIKSGVTVITSSNILALSILSSAMDIDILASKQGEFVNIEFPIVTVIDLDSGLNYKSITVDLNIYANINNISISKV